MGRTDGVRSFQSYQQFCIRVCTTQNDTYPAASMCEHKLDEMGCEFVMPGKHSLLSLIRPSKDSPHYAGNYGFNGTFETCDADVACKPHRFMSLSPKLILPLCQTHLVGTLRQADLSQPSNNTGLVSLVTKPSPSATSSHHPRQHLHLLHRTVRP